MAWEFSVNVIPAFRFNIFIKMTNTFKLLLSIFLLLFGFNCYSQNSKIKWGLYGKKTVEERRATFPFSEAKKVLLISFPDPNMVVENDETGERSKIDSLNLTRWDFKIIKSFKLPEKDYKYYTTEIVELNQNKIDSLSHILINYKLKKNKLPKEYMFFVVGCYSPRNAILFLDSFDKIISYVEICFECHQFYQIPKGTIPNINIFSSLKESSKMIDLIKGIFESNGIEYGVKER